MKLCQLFSIFADYHLGNTSDLAVEGIFTDSRKVGPGSVFVAVRGLRSDGHDFLPQVVRAGAIGLVVENRSLIPPDFEGAVVEVASSRRALGALMERYLSAPAADLFLVAVTGTNGKTSTTYLVEHLLQNFGWPTGVMGTVDHHLGDQVWPAQLTTPDTVEFFERLAQFRGGGARAVAFEISSHSLHQRRVDLLDIDVAVFTNLSRDHLDYHGTLETYFEAKSRLFSEILATSKKPHKLALVYGDSPWSQKLAAGGTLWRYGSSPQCEIRYEILHLGTEGSRFELFTPQGQHTFFVPLVGAHNVANAAAALAVGLFAGAGLETLAEALASFPGVPGRFERVPSPHKAVFVDYAHTDQALASALSTLAAVKKEGQKVWTVFGCGGDRDAGKRPLMGKVAVQGADRVIVTSDNPRGEDPAAIIQDVISGLSPEERAKVQVEPDRRKAIELAIREMAKTDILIIAGKGHEQFQIVGSNTLPLSDFDVARECLNDR